MFYKYLIQTNTDDCRIRKQKDAEPIANGIANYLATNAYLNDTAQDALEMVWTWVNEAPTVELPEPPRWIPVEEALPETIACSAGTAYSEAVIVWTSGKKAMIAVFNGEDFLCDADYWEAWDETITHWMHLPWPLPTQPEEAAHG